ncbi:alpha/beta fold hydrolase [Mucilaginibacter glaciei]|uniref:Alpha/beta hydrolase n=1 Tax=Mucilaginibacter glaciei TaxID=2772109 RepID=A0A926S4U5_9SPHI|nr:alpha/beta hydrolase [Mucilaginibacter glaciei]MBD1392111.1 alpha/beta hydrolase [Mucilaginibacter glaciei]
MTKVYLISGLGADKRLFKNIILPQGFEIVAVDWLLPDIKSTLSDYSQLIINQYRIDFGAVVIGVSLGGIIATEIAKRVRLKAVILISSIKTESEVPKYFKFFKNVPVYTAIPDQLMTHVGFLIKPIFGKMNTEDLNLFKSMLRESSPIFMKWAMKAILNWRNDTVPANLFHLIGDKDLVFPYKNIKEPTAIVKGGTHIMVFDRADEINRLLAGILNNETA